MLCLSSLFLFYFSFFNLRCSFALVTQAGVLGAISAHCNLRLLDSGNSPASASWVAGFTGIRHHAQLMFCIFSRDGGFTTLTRMVSISWPHDPPTSASQSAGLSHHARPINIFIHSICWKGSGVCLLQCKFPSPYWMVEFWNLDAFIYFISLYSWGKVLFCCPGLSAVVWLWLTAVSNSQTQAILPSQPPE